MARLGSSLLLLVLSTRAFAGDWQSSTGTWSGSPDVVMAVAQADWNALWRKAGQPLPAPAVDFNSHVVAGSFKDGAYRLDRQPRFQMTARRPSRPSVGPDLQASVGQTLLRHKDAWQFTASLGPARTQYFDTDIAVKTSGMDVVFKGVQIKEHHLMEAWDVFHKPNPFQALDEPTNAWILRAENVDKGYAVFLQAYHPKFLIKTPGINEHVTAVGTMGGQAVDGPVDLGDTFSSWQLTYGLMNFSLGLEKIIGLAKGKLGSLTYAPGVTAGVMTGTSIAGLRDQNDEWKWTDYPQPLRVIGPSAGLSERLTYAVPGERVNVSVTHQVVGNQLKYKFIDGTAKHRLVYQTVSASVGVRLNKVKHPRRGHGE